MNYKGNGQVLAIAVHGYSFSSIFIFHFQMVTKTWLFNSEIKLKGLYMNKEGRGSVIKMDKDGTTLVIFNKN